MGALSAEPDQLISRRTSWSSVRASRFGAGQCGEAGGVADVAPELALAHLVGVAEGEEADLLQLRAAQLAVRIVDEHPVLEPEVDVDRLGGDEPEVGRPFPDRDAVADQVPAGTHGFDRVRHGPQDDRAKALGGVADRLRVGRGTPRAGACPCRDLRPRTRQNPSCLVRSFFGRVYSPGVSGR